MQGLGVTKDQSAEIQYLEIGRVHGITEVYTLRGDAYLHGYGTPKDYAKASSYLTDTGILDRNLAKVEVVSSNLITRSISLPKPSNARRFCDSGAVK